MDKNKRFWCLDEYKGETSPIVDKKYAPTNEWLCNKLNELYEENLQLKKEIVFLQNSLHDCNMKSRKLVIYEMRDALDKMERYE